MNKEQIKIEIEQAMKSGKYPIASTNLFNSIENIKLSPELSAHLEYTEELLWEFLNELTALSTKTPGLENYLETIKKGDIIDNQRLEKENSFLLALYQNLKKETAIDKLIKLYQTNNKLTGNNIINIHSTLLEGTTSSDTVKIRTENTKFVGHFQNNERVIDYFPINYTEIEDAIEKLADTYNDRFNSKTYNNVFFQPFLIHGLTGALQIFSDGNTRMGRIMQHSLLWQLINEQTKFQFSLPPIYATRSYFPYRGEYRKLISNLVKENNSQVWNNWFDFNLKGIEDNIYASRENIKKLKHHF